MKVLYVHPNCNNLGDTLVEAGAKYLVHEAIGWHYFNQVWQVEAELPAARLMNYDVVILIGTPWFWDGCKKTPKYELLHQIHGLPCKRIALGIGSSFPLTAPWDMDLPADPVWHDFDLVVCRDWITQGYLPAAVPLCCPSLFAPVAFSLTPSKPSLKQVLVYAALDSGSVSADFLPLEVKQKINEEQERLIMDHVTVVTMNYLDGAGFEAHYPGRPALHVTDPAELLQILACYEETISLRIHACCAALSLGRKATLWPLDTRAYTAVACGARSAWPLPETKVIGTSSDAWISLLKNKLL